LISFSDKALERSKALSQLPNRSDKPKVHIETLGCRVNQYESQACKEIFEAFGYECVDYTNWIDCYFINTCSVTLESDRKSRNMIRRMINEARYNNAKVIVCGCHVQANPEEEFDYDNIYLCGNQNKADFVKKVLEGAAEKKEIPQRSEMKCFFDTPVTSSKNTRAFIKIEDGCDNFCSYCIVPYLRGPVRSRDPISILREVEALADKGYTEVVLTGIETSYFGKDLQDGWDLAVLAEKIAQFDKIKRIRFGSLRPTLFTEDFCKRLSAVKKLPIISTFPFNRAATRCWQ
jgi:threonylcarbamoyladenosine tRNA methylthiotransferase MtaB